MFKDLMNQDEGFTRLTTVQFRSDLVGTLKRVILAGERFVLLDSDREVAAIVPVREFERLNTLMSDLKPSQYEPHEEEYYEDEGGIHCVDLEEVEEDFDGIMTEVVEYDEVFGLLPPSKLGERDFDIFMPTAILMNIDHFWVPDYLIGEKNRLFVSK